MAEHRYSNRRKAQFAVRLFLRRGAHRSAHGAELTLVGRTRDISETGIGVIVSASKIKHYLASKDCKIDLAIELPGETIRVEGVPARYQPLEEGGVVKGYFIGIHLTNMDAHARVMITEFATDTKAE